MPRGVRKSPTEKLKEELIKTKEEIQNYKDTIKSLQDKEKQLESELQMEELKEVSTILEEKNMTVAELKEFLNASSVSPKDE